MPRPTRRTVHPTLGHLTVAWVAEAFAVSWNTADDAVLAEVRRRHYGRVQFPRLRHTQRGDTYVTVTST